MLKTKKGVKSKRVKSAFRSPKNGIIRVVSSERNETRYTHSNLSVEVSPIVARYEEPREEEEEEEKD